MTQATSTTKMKWSTPPKKRTGLGGANGSGKTQKFVSVLKTRPNRWAIYKENCSNGVMVTQNKKAFPNTEWTSRKNQDGTFTIYARYIGK